MGRQTQDILDNDSCKTSTLCGATNCSFIMPSYDYRLNRHIGGGESISGAESQARVVTDVEVGGPFVRE